MLACSLGCTSKDVVSAGALSAFGYSTSADTIRLPTKQGGVVEFGPNATLSIGARDTVEIPASSLYSTSWGLFQRDGTPIGSWDDIRSIEVEQLDGAATVAVTACAAVVIIAIAALFKNTPNFGSGGSKGASSSSGAKASSVRSAPSAPTSGSAATNGDVAEAVFRTAEALASSASNQSSITTATDDEDMSTATPLFSRGARRRANVRMLARLDGGACWPGGGSNSDCFVTGARAGVRLIDVFELTGGVRVESNQTKSAALATFGAMFHGETPAAHWFAIAIGANVAFDGVRAHIVPQLSVRFRPVRGLWLGLVPVEPVYATETGGWTMASGVEITGEL